MKTQQHTRRKGGGFFSRLFGRRNITSRRKSISPRMEKDRIEEEYQARIDHIDRQFLIVRKDYSEKEKENVKRQNLKFMRLRQIEDEIKEQINQDRRSGNLKNKAYYNKMRSDKIAENINAYNQAKRERRENLTTNRVAKGSESQLLHGSRSSRRSSSTASVKSGGKRIISNKTTKRYL
jgi:hypothetical protein